MGEGFLNLQLLILPVTDLSVSLSDFPLGPNRRPLLEVQANTIFTDLTLNAIVSEIDLLGGELVVEFNDIIGPDAELVATLTMVPLSPDDGELLVTLTVPFNDLGMTDLSANIVDFPLGNNLFLDVTLDDIVGTFTASVTFKLFAPPIEL